MRTECKLCGTQDDGLGRCKGCGRGWRQPTYEIPLRYLGPTGTARMGALLLAKL